MQTAVTDDQALARRFPEQIAIATAKDAQGKYNPITLGWTMLTSHDPLMMAIAVGRQRYSAEVIRKAGAFVLTFPSEQQAAEALFHGTKSGREMDKLKEAGTKTQPATKIDGVLFADAVANFECELVSEHETGDHVIFVGRVVASHMNEDASLGRLYSLGHERLGGVRPA